MNQLQNDQKYLPEDDYLWQQLKSIPAFRAVLRAVETRFYQPIDLPEPTLDLGCGDGHFSEMTFDKPIAVGIDPWWGPLQKAERSGMYDELIHGMGNNMPFPDGTFASVFSNSVLEHIPDIQPVLNEASRVLQQDGRLMITMPTHFFTEYLRGAAIFEQIGAKGLAERYRKFFNFISRHAHTDSPEVWAARLAQAGFEIERWQYYFSREALHALEWGHVQGLPSAIIHAITGHWIVAPWRSSLQRTEQWLRPFYEEPFNADEGAYVLIVARKKANSPIDAPLPPPQPFSLEELTDNNQQITVNEQPVVIDDEVVLESDSAFFGIAEQVVEEPERETAVPKTNLFSYAMVLLSLLTAVIGQTRIGSNPDVPSQGIGWFLFAAIPLLILGWQNRIFPFPHLPTLRLPTIGPIPSRRWLIILGILFSLLASRFVSTPGSERPFFAFLGWFLAIGTAIFALHEDTSDSDEVPNESHQPEITAQHSQFSILNSQFSTRTLTIVLFTIALLIRAISLSSHPFILNGIEASLGLDALKVANGALRNPFATGWLSNPTLPTFLMAIPIKLFGPSTLTIRLLSPIAGATTVAAIFWIGQRLYGRTVGIVAAVLLAGSHFHLHYSRMGMQNIWDGLLALLALGCIAIAWNEATRSKWLLAGGLIGLNAYFFTGSRLLPVMLTILIAWAILFNRDGLRKNGRHIFVAALMAFVVALPQMLFYQNNPTIFMERATVLGIFAEQTNWLAQEAARTGLSTNTILQNQIWRGLLSFNGGLDNSPAYRPLVPLLSFGPALFFVLGLLTAVFRFKQLKYMMLIVWFGITAVFAGAFLLDVPNSHRLVIVIPALALLAAIAMEVYGRFVLSVLPDGLGERFQAQLLPVLLVIAGLFVAGDLIFYYGRFRVEHSYGDRNTEIADEVAHYLSDLDEDSTAYFFGPPSMYTDFPTIPFLVQNFQRGYNLFDVEPQATLPTAPTDKQLFIFLPERAGEIEAIQLTYPNGQLETFSGHYADPLFHVYSATP